MKREMIVGLLFLLTAGCSKASGDTSAPASSGGAKGDATAAATAAAGGKSATATLGGADWHAVFVGEPPVTLPESRGGGQASGVGPDDTTRRTGDPGQGPQPWKYRAAGGGGVNTSPSGKAMVITNINLKINPTPKTIDLWIKSGLVKDVKQVGGPEVMEIGPSSALALAGAGTCAMKDGSPADFYWHNLYSPGDFAHQLSIVIVAKDAPEEEKQVAVSVLRQIKYTEKAKPYYKKG